MQNYYVNTLSELVSRMKELDSVILVKETLKKICKVLKEDLVANQYKNLPSNMQFVEKISSECLKTEIKDLRAILIEFLVNVVLIFEEQILRYFSIFFLIVVENFDEFDQYLKLAASVLNDALYDIVLSSAPRMNKQVSSLLKKITYFIPESKNERIRIMILKWIYLVDNFQVCDISTDLDAILSNMLYFYTDPRPEVIEVADIKINKLLDRYLETISIDLVKFTKFLKSILQTWQTIHLKKEEDGSRKRMMHLTQRLITSVLRRVERSVSEFFISGFGEGLFTLVLHGIYLSIIKASNDDSQSKQSFANVKLITKLLANQAVSGKHKTFSFVGAIMKSYQGYITATGQKNFRILNEINELAVILLGSSNEHYSEYNDHLQKCIYELFSNNKPNMSTLKYRQFISQTLYSVLEKSLLLHETFLLEVMKKLMEKVYGLEKDSVFEDIRLELLYFFKNLIPITDIFSYFSQILTVDQDMGFLIEFLFQEMPTQNPVEIQKMNDIFYKKSHESFKKVIFKNPIWFILLNLLLNNFEISRLVLYWAVETYTQLKSLKYSIRLNSCLGLLAKYLVHLNKHVAFHFKPGFKRFLAQLLIVMEQNEEFGILMKALKTMKLTCENDDKITNKLDQKEYFQQFLNFQLKNDTDEKNHVLK